MDNKLRYNISSWRQLSDCLSNNSKKLKIRVADIYDTRISALRIAVVHEKYGTLFACTVNNRGELFTHNDGLVYELSINTILDELRKYGFYVTYNKRSNLPSAMLDYLMTIKSLNYDKLRILYTWTAPRGVKEYEYFVVAFMSDKLPEWLDNTRRPPLKELQDALVAGHATNVSKNPVNDRTYRWDWLDYVANIDDILSDNAGV